MHDDQTQALWAMAVQSKGSAPEVAAWVAQKLEGAGYRGVPVTLKTDQEESTTALKRAVAGRKAKTAMIESTVSVSKSYPDVGRAIHIDMAKTIQQPQDSFGEHEQ